MNLFNKKNEKGKTGIYVFDNFGYFGLWVPRVSVYGCHFKRPCNVSKKIINYFSLYFFSTTLP